MTMTRLVTLAVTLCLLLTGLAAAAPLQQSVAEGSVSFDLVGDGRTTSRCRLELTNRTGEELEVTVPAFQTFVPSDSTYQTMMGTEEAVVTVPAGETVVVELPTVCISGKNVPAPPPSGAGYTPLAIEDGLGTELAALVLASRELEEEGQFEAVPIPEGSRQQTLCQLAIWKHLGEKTPQTEDDVTPAVVKHDLLTRAQVDPETLTESQHEEVDEGIDSIFAAIDLTLKQGEDLGGGTIEIAFDTRTKELGILLVRDDDLWIPSNPSRTSVTAQIYERQRGQRRWVRSREKRVITFCLLECSRERGECLNSEFGTWTDLFFEAGRNPDLTCSQRQASARPCPVVGHACYGRATTKQPESSKTVQVSCDDYGAFSTIVASAPGCVPLRKMPGNSVQDFLGEYEVYADRSNAVKVPKDDNDNQIADRFEQLRGMQPNANDDLDNFPVGNGFRGDGFSAYEEYRGFKVNGQHQRTSWLNKDLFIRDQDGLGFAEFASASDITCWGVRQAEWDNDERIVNFNRGHATRVAQHGLRMLLANLPENVLGSTGLGPPNYVQRVRISRAEYGGANRTGLADTVAHELAHGTGVHHHGEPPEGRFVFVRNGLDPNQANQQPQADVPALNHPGGRLGGLALPNYFYLGRKGNSSSGDALCYLRYDHPRPTVGGAADPQGATRMVYIAPLRIGWWFGFILEPVTYSDARTRFCDSPRGTGMNANGRGAGDAVRGNCKAQFVVSDRYTGGR